MSSPPALRQMSFEALASEAAVRTLVNDARTRLETARVDADLCGSVVIVLAEALNNVVEHAYAGLPPGQIRLEIGIFDDEILINICDHGQALPNGTIPPARLPDASGPLESLPEGGFGWYLIHDLTNDMSYTRQGTENHLNLTFARH